MYEIRDDDCRAGLLNALIVRCADCEGELLREAFRAASQVGGDMNRAALFGAIATRLKVEDQKLLQDIETASLQIEGHAPRAAALRTIALRLAGNDRDRVREQVSESLRKAGSQLSQLDALILVASRCGGVDRDALMREVLEEIREVKSDAIRGASLASFASRLKATESELALKIFAEARRIAGSHVGSSVWIAMAQRLPSWKGRIRAEWEPPRRSEDSAITVMALIQLYLQFAGHNCDYLLEEALEETKQISRLDDHFQALNLMIGRLDAVYRTKVLKRLLAIPASLDTSCAIAAQLEESDRKVILERALSTACSDGREDFRSEALIRVVKWITLEDKDLLREALTAARRIGHRWSRSAALIAVAGRLGSSDPTLLREALEEIQQLGDDDRRLWGLNTLAGGLRVSDREFLLLLLSAARQIGDEFYQSRAFNALSSCLKGVERDRALGSALDASQKISHQWNRAKISSAIAARLESGDRELLRRSLEAVRQIEDEWSRAGVLSVLATRLKGSERGFLSSFLGAARQINDEVSRVAVLCASARCLRSGKAKPLIREAFIASIQAREDLNKAKGLCIVLPLVHLRDRESMQEAKRVSLQMRDEESRVKALVAIAEHPAIIDPDFLDGMYEAARHMKDAENEAELLSAIATRLKGGRRQTLLYEALQAAQTIHLEWQRARALGKVIKRLESGDRDLLTAALEATQQITDDGYRSDTLSEIVLRSGKQEAKPLLQKISDTARGIVDLARQAQALTAVATLCEGSERERLLRQALSAALEIEDHDLRAHGVSVVAQQWDPTNLSDLAPAARALIAESRIMGCLAAIADHWPQYLRKERTKSDLEIGRWLDVLSRERRPHLLAAIEALVPAIADAGGVQAIRDTSIAVEDVSLLWS
jgi:hypothetical protein